jgi:hypothetical protein
MVTLRCRTQPRTHIASLIAGHYSDRLLARTSHERVFSNRGFATATSLNAWPGAQAGGLTIWSGVVPVVWTAWFIP